MTYRAFLSKYETFRTEYYPSPARWEEYSLDEGEPIKDSSKWSDGVKYLKDDTHVTSEINSLPNNTGGIYMFYIEGGSLSFIEKYILYIGRCKYTEGQNIRKRAMEYLNDDRFFIKKMFELWGPYLHYKYYGDTDNSRIVRYERALIMAIAPPFNDSLPEKLEVEPEVSAFC